MRQLTMLDCFCGLGGASEGFAKEGFNCTGIDIVNVGYPYRFILSDMQVLDGKDFRGYDVIWGSPPCRDFSQVNTNGKGWKIPKNPEHGMILVQAFLRFIQEAQPRFWILENVNGLSRFLPNPSIRQARIGFKRHVFYGNFPTFLLPESNKFKVRELSGWTKNVSQIRAKIPFACSQAFAHACKEALLEKEEG